MQMVRTIWMKALVASLIFKIVNIMLGAEVEICNYTLFTPFCI